MDDRSSPRRAKLPRTNSLHNHLQRIQLRRRRRRRLLASGHRYDDSGSSDVASESSRSEASLSSDESVSSSSSSTTTSYDSLEDNSTASWISSEDSISSTGSWTSSSSCQTTSESSTCTSSSDSDRDDHLRLAWIRRRRKFESQKLLLQITKQVPNAACNATIPYSPKVKPFRAMKLAHERSTLPLLNNSSNNNNRRQSTRARGKAKSSTDRGHDESSRLKKQQSTKLRRQLI